MFSAYVYTGVTGSNVTINNGIDLSGSGGLIWSKGRNGANPNSLTDTVRGVANGLNSASIFSGLSSGISSFTSTGYVTNQAGSTNGSSSETYVSWTLRKQSKFFDIQTWTGSGANRTISHNLGSVPGCIMVKCLDDDLAWAVYHRSLANTEYLVLNTTAAKATGATWWNSTTPTSSVFSLGTDSTVNASAKTYVAYIFAHDAGGFGLTGTDNVISCGSYTTDGSGNFSVNLGYEPQWIMVKRTSSTGNWLMFDNMRGLGVDGTSYVLYADVSNAEAGPNNFMSINSTGFGRDGGTAGQTFIYIAIRRGPMKVPTVGTSVFSPTLVTGNGTNDRQITGVGFPPDLLIGKTRSSVQQPLWYDKLRGKGRWLESSNTLAEQTLGGGSEGLMLQDGFVVDFNYGSLNSSGITYIDWCMRRAPSFFDEVCWTGDGTYGRNVSHNLGTKPLFLITKKLSTTSNWVTNTWNGSSWTDLKLNTTAASTGNVSGIATSTTFNPDSILDNVSATTYVTYLFATCAGVSKVGSYTGTGTTLQIDCGFTAGARFVLIKRRDSTGDWYVWDSARGIVAGNDPYLLLNSTAAEDTSTDYIDTYSAGFEISSTAPAAINASAGTFVFLAIA